MIVEACHWLKSREADGSCAVYLLLTSCNAQIIHLFRQTVSRTTFGKPAMGCTLVKRIEFEYSHMHGCPLFCGRVFGEVAPATSTLAVKVRLAFYLKVAFRNPLVTFR